ncbi:hypothetical protein [Streptomyces luteogriseus]|uniref:hypothetical protein n=1 Tax=Streptomyces luteogriseus TaxID=68233 RepID=UPI003817B833
MSARRQFLVVALHSFLAGAIAGATMNAVWFLATGELPSVVTTVIAADIVTAGWGAVQALRFRRKWQAVLDSYNQPALGEGIDIPHRPPAEEEQGKGGAAA